jgi:hypothetical protein
MPHLNSQKIMDCFEMFSIKYAVQYWLLPNLGVKEIAVKRVAHKHNTDQFKNLE